MGLWRQASGVDRREGEELQKDRVRGNPDNTPYETQPLSIFENLRICVESLQYYFRLVICPWSFVL